MTMMMMSCYNVTELYLQVNNQEMVSLVRQPDNRYDPNAVRVDNVSGVQVGHIKRELAKPLASVMDRRLARVEGSAFCHYHLKKNCTLLFLQELCQNCFYYDNFWHTYTSVNPTNRGPPCRGGGGYGL